MRAMQASEGDTAWHVVGATPTMELRAIRYRTISHGWAFHPKLPNKAVPPGMGKPGRVGMWLASGSHFLTRLRFG